MKFDSLILWAMFPWLVTVFSEIVQRKVWREARSVGRINKALIKVNRAMGRFMARNRAMVVRHKELWWFLERWGLLKYVEPGTAGWQRDGSKDMVGHVGLRG